MLEWARGRGVDVPSRLKVIGFDGTTAIRRALPALATIRQPLDLIARKAVELLVAQIDAPAHSPGDGDADGAPPTVEFPVAFLPGRTL